MEKENSSFHLPSGKQQHHRATSFPMSQVIKCSRVNFPLAQIGSEYKLAVYCSMFYWLPVSNGRHSITAIMNHYYYWLSFCVLKLMVSHKLLRNFHRRHALEKEILHDIFSHKNNNNNYYNLLLPTHSAWSFFP